MSQLLAIVAARYRGRSMSQCLLCSSVQSRCLEFIARQPVHGAFRQHRLPTQGKAEFRNRCITGEIHVRRKFVAGTMVMLRDMLKYPTACMSTLCQNVSTERMAMTKNDGIDTPRRKSIRALLSDDGIQQVEGAGKTFWF
jgi:hypothetical protein